MMAYTHKLIRFLHYLRIENLHNILPHIPVYYQTGKGSKYILLLENGRHHSSKMWYCRLYNIIMLQHLDAWGLPYKSSLICQLWWRYHQPSFCINISKFGLSYSVPLHKASSCMLYIYLLEL